MNCKNCGEILESSSGFCPMCGTPVEAQSAPVAETPAAPEVRAEYTQPAAAPAPQQVATAEKPKEGGGFGAFLKKNSKGVIAAAVVVVLLAAALLIGLGLGKSGNSNVASRGDDDDVVETDRDDEDEDDEDAVNTDDVETDEPATPSPVTGDPDTLISDALADLVTELGDGLAGSPLDAVAAFADGLAGGTTTFMVDYIDYYGDSLSAALSLLTNEELSEMMLTADVVYNDEEVGASILVNDKRIAVASPLLGDGYYGVTYATIAQEIMALASNLELDEATLAEASAYADMISELFNGSALSDLPSYSTEAAEVYVDFIMEQISRIEADVQAGVEADINGIPVDTTLITYTVSRDDMIDFLEGLLEVIENDDELYSLFEAIDNMDTGSMFPIYATDAGAYTPTAAEAPASEGAALPETSSGYSFSTYESFIDGLSSMIEELEYYEDIGIDLRFFIDDAGRLVLAECAAFSDGVDSGVLQIMFGANKGDEWVITTTSMYSDGTVYSTSSVTFGITSSGGTHTLRLATDSDYDYDSYLFILEWTEDGEFTLIMEDYWDTYEIDGYYEVSGDYAYISLDDLLSYDEYGDYLNISMMTQGGASIPDPSFTSIGELDMAFFESLVEALSVFTGAPSETEVY